MGTGGSNPGPSPVATTRGDARPPNPMFALCRSLFTAQSGDSFERYNNLSCRELLVALTHI